MIIIQLKPFLNLSSLNQIELLSAKLSDAMQKNLDITCRTDEGFSFYENGFYTVLDRLCEYWNYNGNRITLETNNWKESHPVYSVKKSAYSTPIAGVNIPETTLEWTREKTYGIFLGRSSIDRLYGIIKHRKFPFNNQGLSSFNQSIEGLEFRNIIHLMKHRNVAIEDIINIQPYSDIDSVRTIPIIPPYNSDVKIWQTVYKQIAIELVFETNQSESAFQVTEKILRPIAHKRPFIVVAPSGFLRDLKNIGFKTFDDYIPNWYDNFSGLDRVDNAFIVLQRLFQYNLFDNLLSSCYADIKHNYDRLLELVNHQRDQQLKNKNYYNFLE